MEAGENAGETPVGTMAQAVVRALTLADGPGSAEDRLHLVCTELRTAMTPAADRPRGAARLPLSERQLKTLGLLAQGLSNRGIARRLDLAEETVKCQVRLLLDRLNVTNRTALALWAVREGIVPLHGGAGGVSSPP